MGKVSFTSSPRWLAWCLGVATVLGMGNADALHGMETQLEPARVNTHGHLSRAKVYLAAGDYRRAIEACQRNIDHAPSVEAYVYLAYVYEALDGYLAFIVKQQDYVKVEQLSLNLTAREVIDLIDPPNVLPRMAQELIHEGIRQQFDITASMANRLNRARTDELWIQQTAWRKAHPDSWWAGVPSEWSW